ncbi:hypothetical protein HYS72_02760 [Candidatus Pacearchaeota archaeon]|nr:hypothetical protein [Candidatus Pacearchaeota archaeon]MBI2056923.1 hypothetical protein [Candidatus Pacearchaeota archaeon]
MEINTFIQVQKFVEAGEYKKLEELLKKENILFNAGENLTDGKFLIASVWQVKGEMQQKITSVLEKYGMIFQKYQTSKSEQNIYDVNSSKLSH